MAYYPKISKGTVIFGKNSDRAAGETQYTIHERIPRLLQPQTKLNSGVYLHNHTIPQASETYSILISQIDWMWGCEHGANEHGVVTGNAAVWIRLGLERGSFG